jgi:hypothetical protein
VKVRMKFQITGTRNGLRWPEAGGVVDLPASEANDLLGLGYADRVADEPEVAKPAKAVARKAEKRA